MKKLLLAIAAMVAMSGAYAQYGQPSDFGLNKDRQENNMRRDHRHHRVHIPDRVETRSYWHEGRRVTIRTIFRCTDQRRGVCTNWVKIKTERVRDHGRRWDRDNDGRRDGSRNKGD